MALTMAEVARDYETDGVPSSGAHKIKKGDLRNWGAWVEGLINAFTANGGLIFSSKATLDASLAYAANTMAWVIGDATTANNGIYQKQGASGAGSWTRVADLPFSFIVASDVGAGTANAIQATTSIPVSASALIWMNIFEANTASPVTVVFNGGSALTIKTNSGNDVAAGGLVAGMIVLGIVSGSTFRLVSDQASASIVAAAEAAQVAAEAAQAAAEAAAASAANKVAKAGDTMTGGLSIDITADSGTGAHFVGGRKRTAAAPQTNDEISSLYAKSIDPTNANSIRTRALIAAIATENHNHVANTNGHKARLSHVPRGSATAVTGLEHDEQGLKARVRSTGSLEHIAIDPRSWGALGNASTDDTSAFTALETFVTGRDIDCAGLVFKVTAIPTGNNYRHGFWAKSNGEATNPKDVLYPMEGTFEAESYKLTSSRRYDGWPQDKWHEYDGVIFAVWNQGSTHTSDDLHVCMARSYDGGRTFIDFERLFQSRSFTGGVTSWAAGIVDGQQIVIVRESETATEHRLYCRRIGQKKKVTGQIVATSGSTGYEFIVTTHGVRSGNKIKFNANVSIGGTTLVAGTEYNVTNGTGTRFFFTGPSASSSETLASATYVIEFVESGWTEINWAGVALGTHFINTSADQTGQATLFHSFAGVPASGGDFYTCAHGGGATAGVTLIKIEDVLGNSPTLAKYNKITTNNRVEASVTRDPADGYLYGFARTQFTDQSPLAWWSSDGGDTFNTNITGPVGALQYSPFPCKIVGDTIYAYGSANRAGTDDVSGNYVKTEVPLYLFRGDKTTFRTNYWAALQMIEIGTAYKYSDYAGTNAVGVGSMVVFNGNLILAHSTDNEDPGLGTGIPDIEMVRIRLEDEVIQNHGYQKLVGRSTARGAPALAMYDKLHVEELTGSSGFHAEAVVNGTTGALFGARNITASHTSTGTTAITWPAVGSSNRVFAHAQSRNGNGKAQCVSVTTTGCTVLTKTHGTNTLADYDFDITVWYISDWSRTSWT